MAITVAEKEHWKERIAKRIDGRIERLVAENDPTLLKRTQKDARAKAYENLGIGKLQQELEDIEQQQDKLKDRERRLKAEQSAIINGTTPEKEEREYRSYACYDVTVARAVNQRAAALESDILGQSELGKEILALRAEKENLLDTVWLATSPTQIKELWSQVNSLLDMKPTALEEKALKMEAVKEE